MAISGPTGENHSFKRRGLAVRKILRMSAFARNCLSRDPLTPLIACAAVATKEHSLLIDHYQRARVEKSKIDSMRAHQNVGLPLIFLVIAIHFMFGAAIPYAMRSLVSA